MSLNKVMIIGHLGQDPQVHTFPDNSITATINVATTEHWKDKETGERRENTEWHRIVFYRGLAEIVADYLRKGAQVYIEGKLRTRKWQDGTGQDRYSTEIVGEVMRMLDKRPQEQGYSDSGYSDEGYGDYTPPAAPAPRQQARQQAQQPAQQRQQAQQQAEPAKAGRSQKHRATR